MDDARDGVEAIVKIPAPMQALHAVRLCGTLPVRWGASVQERNRDSAGLRGMANQKPTVTFVPGWVAVEGGYGP